MVELDERAKAMLQLEAGSWRGAAAKDRAIRQRFDLSSARYHQLLNRLIERPEALRYDPVLVRRLRRLREDRRRKRSARRCVPRS